MEAVSQKQKRNAITKRLLRRHTKTWDLESVYSLGLGKTERLARGKKLYQLFILAATETQLQGESWKRRVDIQWRQNKCNVEEVELALLPMQE